MKLKNGLKKLKNNFDKRLKEKRGKQQICKKKESNKKSHGHPQSQTIKIVSAKNLYFRTLSIFSLALNWIRYFNYYIS
jgi:hypothetical protein